MKSIGEMLDELPRSRVRNDHILESNIVVSIPVYDQCVSEMRVKQKPKVKKQGQRVLAEKEKAEKEK